MIGQTVSHYKVLEKLGEGGMGVVYRAEDHRLKRPVALKFLPATLTADPDARGRFIHEAQAASALDHPNICTLFEINETDDGQLFIAMAYYQGETLKERIEQGRLTFDQATGIAIQVAQGLAKAHASGIVHRDIKPANIIVTDDGIAKILDFGLAKLTGHARLTHTGSTVGTVGYMSPEQAQGLEVDQRTDLWALGVVLYEMSTGHSPFRGDHEAALLYSIVNENPIAVSAYLQDPPQELVTILDRALKKSPAERYQSAGDLLADLTQLERHSDSSGKLPSSFVVDGSVARHRFGIRTIPWIILAGFAVVLLGVLIFLLAGRQPPLHKSQHTQITFTGRVTHADISPDGRFLAFCESTSLSVKDMAGGSPIVVFNANKPLNVPRWSPSGTEILVGDDEGLYLVPRLGGGCRRFPAQRAYGWAPDGSRFAGATAEALPDEEQVFFTDIATGRTTPIPGATAAAWLRSIDWSPNGHLMLLDNETISIDGKTRALLPVRGELWFSPRWSPKRSAVYYLDSAGALYDLVRIDVDPESGEPVAERKILLTGLQPRKASFSVSSDGKRLVYVRTAGLSNLWLMDFGESSSPIQKEHRQLTFGTATVCQPVFSPDERAIAYRSQAGPQTPMSPGDVNVLSLSDGQIRRLATLPGGRGGTRWSPDGLTLGFVDGSWRFWTVAANGSSFRSHRELPDGMFTWLTSSCLVCFTYSSFPVCAYHLDSGRQEFFLQPDSTFGALGGLCASRDGERLAVIAVGRTGAAPAEGIWIIHLKTQSCRLLSARDSSGSIHLLRWSADGKWIYAAQWNESRGPHDAVRLSEPVTILRISSSTGRTELLHTLPPDVGRDLDISGDAGRIVYARVTDQSDVWLVDDFDPDIQ